jgi:hypothetical protein
MNAQTPMNPLIEALQASTMLVTLTISAWSSIRVDRDLSGDVADARSSEKSAFSVRKNLLHGADRHLKDINAVQAAFRRYHYETTLPFGPTTGPQDRGPRLLATVHFMPYAQRLAKAVTDMKASVDALTADYARSVETARQKLGAAFDPADYPDPAQLPRLFGINADFQPVPNGKAFRGLPDATLDGLASYMDKQLAERADAASKALAERVTAYLKRLTGRLKALDETVGKEGVRKAAVHASLFEEAGEIAALVKSLGFVANQDLTDAVDLLLDVSRMDAETLTEDREAIAERAADVWGCFDA